ncbi:MAG TPA: hypothetical protein VHH73_08500 [Verrucomicrobiae bacterium]|nr:hypothetical protein [Verrucomicrobiae bacterium]
MNEPNADLKQLMRAAGRAARREGEPGAPPEWLVHRVLRERHSARPETASLAEKLVRRGAAWAAVAGFGALGMQLTTSGFSYGLLRDGAAPYLVVLRFFQP